MLHLLPETIFGMDTDDILAYSTPKVAYVRDRYVGALYYFLMFLAMCWVLGGQVLWRNEHFLLKDVKGVSRMLLSHPTRNQCDANKADCSATFASMSELAYCKEHEDGAQVQHAAPCLYADKHSLFPEGTVGSQVFIPTSLIEMEEVKDCRPGALNNFSCANEYTKDKDSWGGKGYYFNETNMQYYADIESYTVQFTSTYHREDISGTSLDHPGFYTECMDTAKHHGKDMTWKQRLSAGHSCSKERRMPVECMAGVACDKGGLKTHGMKHIEDKTMEKLDVEEFPAGAPSPADAFLVQIPGVKTSRRSLRHSGQMHLVAEDAKEDRPTPDVYASTWGDTFKIGKLMQLANIDLDRHFNMDKISSRMAGTVIEVEVIYSNLQVFWSSLGLSQVQYTYRVKERKLPYVSREYLQSEQPKDFPERRKYSVQHGILLDFKVSGEFGFFSIVYLLIMLTTSLALIATAHKVTDLTSLYLHPRKCNYFHLKYEVSGDFSDMWKCETCEYYNHLHDATCKGLDKWMSAIDTEPCGEKRPAVYDTQNNRRTDHC